LWREAHFAKGRFNTTPDRLEQANRFIEKQLAKKGETIDSLGEAREVTRPPGRTPGYSPRQ
jgi:hypothetical protein